MPFKVQKKNKQFCVVNSDTGKEHACHPTRAKAMSQMKAMLANGADRASSRVAGNVIECFEGDCGRKFLDFAMLESHLSRVHPLDDSKWDFSNIKLPPPYEIARMLDCPKCDRKFLDKATLSDHSDYVHTFEDLRMMVGEAIREKYAKSATASTGSTYAWVQDMTPEIVYFQVEKPQDCTTFQATYSVSGTEVTLGNPTEVVRRTVYEPVDSKEKD